MKKFLRIVALATGVTIVFLGSFLIWREIAYPTPYRTSVQKSGLDRALVYSVIKAESKFNKKAISRAGAVGLMQILPQTAQFVCEREKIDYDENRLIEGEYNILLGSKYLQYLLERFTALETVLAAYNAGEGTVSEWLRDEKYSRDGITLNHIPYPETKKYVKKVIKFIKIYSFLY